MSNMDIFEKAESGAPVGNTEEGEFEELTEGQKRDKLLNNAYSTYREIMKHSKNADVRLKAANAVMEVLGKKGPKGGNAGGNVFQINLGDTGRIVEGLSMLRKGLEGPKEEIVVGESTAEDTFYPTEVPTPDNQSS